MANTTTSKSMDELKSDIDNLKADISNITKTLKKMVGESKDDGLKNLDNLKSNAQDRANDAMQSVEKSITEKPFTSILIAFAVGLVFGKIFEKR